MTKFTIQATIAYWTAIASAITMGLVALEQFAYDDLNIKDISE
jgi:hypothetical protein